MVDTTTTVPAELKQRAKELRAKIAAGLEVVTDADWAEATPFYLALRGFLGDLRQARLDQGLTLADVAAKTGLAVETLSRLETGALTNPTFQTLARYAAAVNRRLRLTAEGTGA